MIENAGITEAQLKERIAESHLYQIPNIIGDGWRDLVPQLGLSDEAENATEALKRWWTGVGDTSYRSLVVALLRVNRLTHAEKVITLVKGQLLSNAITKKFMCCYYVQCTCRDQQNATGFDLEHQFPLDS